MKSLLVIPARLSSTRLEQKLLLSGTGKPLLQHTYEAAAGCQLAQDIIVAADDPRIVAAVEGFGGNVELTSADHASGTDRIAEIAERHPDVELFVNVQGDEPEIDPADIDMAIQLLLDQQEGDMATLAIGIRNPDRINDPSCVKVVFDQMQRALYFSRCPIPYSREPQSEGAAGHRYFQHVGLYVYRRETLLELTRTPRAENEIAESLEQLRALHLGKKILVGITTNESRGIDTPDDYQAFVSRFGSC